MNPAPLLTLITFTPLLGMILIVLIPGEKVKLIKGVALAVSAIPLALAVFMWVRFIPGQPGMQFEEFYPWIPALNVYYHLGVDGISAPLVLLTALLTPTALIYSALYIHERVKAYFALFLMLEMGMFGVFASLNFVLFYFFWEIGLVPMYFLINIWGGENRRYASFKFFVYTLTGSIAMLLAIQVMYLRTGSFSILEMGKLAPFAGNFTWQSLAFWAFFLAFAIKVPVWPFHTWLPDAHVEAPTAGSVILAGVLLKMGGYGFLRILLPTFPDAARAYAPALAVLALISIVFGALKALAQEDFKKLVAYSSVSHMGYVTLGVAAAVAVSAASADDKAMALEGAVLQMFNHGLSAAALFFLVGVVYERAHTRNLKDFGGLGVRLPLYSGILTVATLSSLGLPGLNGFVGEFLVFRGAFPIFNVITPLATLGLIVTAGYLLWMVQRVLHGPVTNPKMAEIGDMNRWEVIALTPIMVLMFAIGLYPSWILNTINQAALQFLSAIGG